MSKIRLYMFFLCLSLSAIVHAQNSHENNVKHLDQLLKDKKFGEAQTFLTKDIAALKSNKSYFLLTDYIYYAGKIKYELSNKIGGTQAALLLANTISNATDSLKVLRQIQLNLAQYYEFVGDSKTAYDSNKKALEITKKWDKATPQDLGLIESNLAVLSNRKGDISQSIKHAKKALALFESYSKTEKKNLYVIYNVLGGSLWFESKIDSALHYYKKADKTLKLMESNPLNSYYRPAILQNNMAGIYEVQGNIEMALKSMDATIKNLYMFLKSDAADNKEESAKEFLFTAIDNYAGFYKETGNFEKAKELLHYSYQEKQKHFDSDNPELYKSKVLLGQIYLSLKNYSVAERFLTEGINHIRTLENGPNYWKADAYSSKALLYDEQGKFAEAKVHYDQAELFYKEAYEGSYDEMYLDFTLKASNFYARNQQKEKALKMAHQAYDYLKENQESITSFEIQQALNLGSIYYELGDYKTALKQANTTVTLLQAKYNAKNVITDSSRIIVYMPQTILLRSKATYKIQKNRSDISFLKNIYADLNEAIVLVEKQKTLVGNDDNVSLLIENNAELFGFSKKIALQIYNKTQDKKYLDDFVSLHESILYNRIRSRLNSKSSINYANVPAKILGQEKEIKKLIKESLSKSDNMHEFIKANAKWNSYLKNLEKNYPKYYKLRFGSIKKSLKDIEQKVPKYTTIIRYIYDENVLYAVVISKKNTQVFKLNTTNVQSNISKLQDVNSIFKNNFKILNDLYISLWKPFETQIKTDKVIVIPDRDLFNLSFEILTPKLISNYKDLATNSLLSKHVISYNYSLFLIDKESKTIGYKDNFVAFVPEFNDKMKSDYQISVKDSVYLDKTYLTLLSQPFTKDLAQQSAKLFKGISFLNEKSTEKLFKNSAKEHKIIHIGTHAESNNITPELSRLVFAKSTGTSSSEDNYLYTYEIYNANLSSNLAILTACETGKPTYQAGEGMISLAHAFNYAGSESILTSLWKIDEQSSARIVASFYKYLKKGWSKDKALQQAKLDYIATAEGRTLHPHYWAGLVLIGDPSPIAFHSELNFMYWIIGIIGILAAFYLFHKKNLK